MIKRKMAAIRYNQMIIWSDDQIFRLSVTEHVNNCKQLKMLAIKSQPWLIQFSVTHFMTFFIQHILTNLSKHSTDNALDEDQCPGKSELLLTIIASSSGKEVKPQCVKCTDDNESQRKSVCDQFYRQANVIKGWESFLKRCKAPSEVRGRGALNYNKKGGVLALTFG